MTPQNLQVQANGGLSILWSDTGAVLNPCNLRWHCRCAACRRLWVQGLGLRVEPDVQVVNVSPVGSYGVQLRFSDGHDHGVFPWTYLRELAGLSASKDADDPGAAAG
jgi:DUF971 family protein